LVIQILIILKKERFILKQKNHKKPSEDDGFGEYVDFEDVED